jgi:hypothetical protein
MWFASCSPQVIYMHSKDYVEPPPAGMMRDTFLYGRASGPADVVIAFDNSISLENGISFFKQTYESLVQDLESGGSTRLIDFRVQVVTAEQSRSPRALAAPGQDPSGQFAELFTDSPGGPAILSADPNAREGGSPRPFEAVTTALAQSNFNGRSGVPLFIVAVLGGEADPSDLAPQAVQTFGTALDQARGLYQSNLLILDKGSGSGFPACGDMTQAPEFEAAVNGIKWSTSGKADLCDSTWSNWQTGLISTLVAQKTRIVLSHVPYLPPLMILRSANRVFRYSDDYTWNPSTNEIVFARDPGLQTGDPLEAVYYLTPAPTPIPGGTGPLPFPSPSPQAPR